MVWCGVMCCAVMCSVMWCGVVWCGVVCCAGVGCGVLCCAVVFRKQFVKKGGLELRVVYKTQKDIPHRWGLRIGAEVLVVVYPY